MKNQNSSLYVKIIATTMLTAALVSWLLILLRINRGTSCDEGYYLQSYMSNQLVLAGLTDFYSLVRSFASFFPDDNALILRYVSLFANFIALALLGIASWRFFLVRHDIYFNKTIYFSTLFLAGAIGFCFASPILYYDNIQAIIYFLTFAAFYLFLSRKYQIFSLIAVGFLLVFSLTNYLSSGVLLLFSIIILSMAFNELNLKNLLWSLLGFMLGVVFYHFFIRHLVDWIDTVMYELRVSQDATTGHSNTLLLLFLWQYIVMAFRTIILPALLIALFVVFDKLLKNKILNLLVFAFQLLILTVWTVLHIKTTYTNLFLLPIIVLIANYIANKKITFNRSFLLNALRMLIYLSLPVMAVFGTNQLFAAKMEFFMPFWFIAFTLMMKKNQDILSPIKRMMVYLFFAAIFFTGYVFLGYFDRYQYYYTPKKSTEYLENTENFKRIKVAPFQKQFIEHAIALMRENGYTKGDGILAFGENQIVSFAAGAIIPNKFVYHILDFVQDRNNIPVGKVNFILINQNEEQKLIDFIGENTWGFPEKYHRYDLGRYAENMQQGGSNTILYCAKKE